MLEVPGGSRQNCPLARSVYSRLGNTGSWLNSFLLHFVGRFGPGPKPGPFPLCAVENPVKNSVLCCRENCVLGYGLIATAQHWTWYNALSRYSSLPGRCTRLPGIFLCGLFRYQPSLVLLNPGLGTHSRVYQSGRLVYLTTSGFLRLSTPS